MHGMHHHRLVLTGPPLALRPLVDELRRAGATVVDADDPPRLVWSTSDPRLVERLALRHAEVAVGVERFEALGSEMVRLVVRGGEATVLDRRRVLPTPGDDDLEAWGNVDEDEGLRLDQELLRRAAGRVELRCREVPPAGALGSALAVGCAFGALCAFAREPYAPAAPGERVLHAVADLAASALLVSAAPRPPAPAEARVERAWALTSALARAGAEALWDRPGEAAWAEWLGYLVASTSDVLLACAESIDGGATAIASVHREHFATPDEQRAWAAGALVATCLQAIALFDTAIR